MSGFDGILYLSLLIFFAKLFEEIAVRFKLPQIIGYVMAGIVLGPAILAWVQPVDEITLFIQIGVFFLFFLIGLEEIDVLGIFSALRKRLFAGAAVGFIVPFALGTVSLLYLTDLEFTPVLAIASVIGISSLGVVAKVLADYGKLKEPLGLEIFTLTALLEFIGIIVASVFIQLSGPSNLQNVINDLSGNVEADIGTVSTGPFDYISFLWLFARMIIFLAGVTVFGLFVLPRLVGFIRNYLKVREMYFGMMVGIILLVAYFADVSGVHGAIGALLLGVLLSQMPKKDYEDMVKGVHGLAHGIFIPIFFAGIGVYFSFSFVNLPYYLIAAVLATVTLGKFAGGMLAAMVSKLRPIITVGSGVMAKGAVDLAIMLSLLSAGIIMPELFSLIVFGVVIMLVVTSIMLKRGLSKPSAAPGEMIKVITSEETDTVMPLYARVALLDLRVKDIYTESPPVVQADISVQELAQLEDFEWKSAYIVQDHGKYLGIVKQADLSRIDIADRQKTLISDITEKISPVRMDDFIYEVIERMALHNFSLLAVVSADQSVIGGLMQNDVLRYIGRH